MNRPLISVCINSHNEGFRLRETVRAFRENLGDWPHEFVIVADEITDGGADGLDAVAAPAPLQVIRNAARKGCAQCKRMAIAAATGDVLIFVDAHQNVLKGLLSDMAMRALAEDAIFTPVVRNIEYDAQHRARLIDPACQIPYEKGMRFTCDQYAKRDLAWADAHHLQEIKMVGVGLAISRKTLDRLGGFNRYIGLHGSQERGIALRAFMADVPVKLDSSVHVGHEYRAGKPRPPGYRKWTSADQARNYWHAYFVVSGPEAWKALEPRMHGLARLGADVVKRPEVIAERDTFQRQHKRRTDRDLLEFLQVIPTAAEKPAAPAIASGIRQPKIDVRIAYEPGGRIGADYNRIMRESAHE